MAKILLVEDDNNLREIYEARLQAEGYEIVSANDGEAALVVAKNEKPDLIISDVMMPKISGFEMLDILRNTQGLEDVKVIMLTALGQADDQARANKLGADRYLVKSQVTLEDIVKVSHELLEGAAPAAPADAAATAAAIDATGEAPAPATTDAVEVTTPPAPAPEPAPAVQSIPVSTPPADEPAAAVPSEPTATTPVPEPPATTTEPAPAAPADTPTTSSEESAVKQQIEDFISTQPTEPPAAVEPQPEATPEPEVTTPETPAPATAAPAATSNEADDQAALESAVDTIVANGNAEAEPVTTPTPPVITVEPPAQPLAAPEEQTEESPAEAVSIAHKKVIKPLDSQPGKSLDELLATEAANESITTTAQPVLGDVTASAPAQNEEQPSDAPAQPPHAAGTVIDPNGNHVDPNSISL